MREWKDWLSGEAGGCYSCAVSDILCNLVWISLFLAGNLLQKF